MSHQGAVVQPEGLRATTQHVSKIIFREAVNDSFAKKVKIMYPGLSYAVLYKIAQRVYKFGGQPLARDLLMGHTGSATGTPSTYVQFLRSHLSERNSRIAVEASAGCLVGIGEVMLLPLDILKIKAQTNPLALKGRTGLQILMQERMGMYKGASWTLARNIPGSIALFGGSAATKEYLFNIHGRAPSLFETFVASAVGSIGSLMLSSPFDVVKTRVQNQSFGSKLTGAEVVASMIRKEGFSSFFRGITPKLFTVGPKLICSFTAAQYLSNFFFNAYKSSFSSDDSRISGDDARPSSSSSSLSSSSSSSSSTSTPSASTASTSSKTPSPPK